MARSRLGAQAEVDLWVGRFIGERRRALGLTQGEVGRLIGLTTQQVHRYEVGKNGLSTFVMLQLSEVLQCELNDFVRLVPKPGAGERTTAAKRASRHEGDDRGD